MLASKKIYSNSGNQAVIDLVDRDCHSLLDVGCGDGSNSRVIRQQRPDLYIEGITRSPEESILAKATMNQCFVQDIEVGLPSGLSATFDTILFSHVLEHLAYPAAVLARFLDFLKPGGQLLIAVPNVVAWRTRWGLIRGRFEYEEFGVFDNTHLRFFTYLTAANYLLSESSSMKSVHSSVEGSVPLGPLRKLLPASNASWLDIQGCKHWPNLFGSQVLVDARKADA